jgi:uncharacterized protein (DUF58 family)
MPNFLAAPAILSPAITACAALIRSSILYLVIITAPFLLVLLSNFWGALQNPTPLIPLASVSFQCKTFRTMLVRGKMFAGEGRLKLVTVKKWDGSDEPMFFNTLIL